MLGRQSSYSDGCRELHASIYEVMPSYTVAGYVLFALVFLMSAIVYKLGFAKKLRPLQNLVIYIFLFIGCLSFDVSCIFPSDCGGAYRGSPYINHLSCPQDE